MFPFKTPNPKPQNPKTQNPKTPKPQTQNPMEPQGFPYEPTLIAFAIGTLIGIYRGMQARVKERLLSTKERIAQVRERGCSESSGTGMSE